MVKRGLLFRIFVVILLLFVVSPALLYAFEVAVVKSSDIKPYNDAVEGFKESCNCKLTEISENDADSLVNKIIKKSPDAVFAVGTEAFRKVKSLNNLPVIYTMVMPSEVSGLRQENLYGVSMDVSPETALRTLFDVFHDRKKIGIIYDAKHTGAYVKEITELAAKHGLKITASSVRNTSDVPAALNTMEKSIDLFWMLPDATVVTKESFHTLLLFSFRNNVPVFTFSRKYAELGAVCSLSLNPFDVGVQAGDMASALSEGKKPPRKAYVKKTALAINKKIADKMSIYINNEIVRRAEVIE